MKEESNNFQYASIFSRFLALFVNNRKRTGLRIFLSLFASITAIVFIIGAIFIYFESKKPRLIDYGPPINFPLSLTDDLTWQVSQYRVIKGKKQYPVVNQLLCDYSQKRLKDFRDNDNQYDDARGFLKDTNDQQMKNIYFSTFSIVNEAYFPINQHTKSTEIMTILESNPESILSIDYDSLCIQSNDKNLIIIVASKYDKSEHIF